MSRFSMVLLCALVGALVLSAEAGAATSKYCRLIPQKDLGGPVGASRLTTQATTIVNPSLTKAKGRITLCQFSAGGSVGVVAQTSVARFANTRAARGEFDALVKNARSRDHLRTTRMSGPWSAGFLLGTEDGLLVTKGRYTFHIQYASGAPGFAKITPQTLARLAAKAVRKL